MRENAHEFVDMVYYTPDELDKSMGLYLLRMGTNKAKPNYHVGPRIIADYSIHFVLEGSVELITQTEQVIVEADEIFCFFPQVTHEYGAVMKRAERDGDSKTPLRMIWVAFNGAQARFLLQQAGLTPAAPAMQGRSLVQVKQALTQLFHYVQQMGSERYEKLMLQSLLYRLFAELTAAGRAAQPADRQVDWLHKSIEYIHNHFAENISVSQIAAYADIHRSHFSNRFKAQLGCTPKQYITELKMKKAVQLLQENQYTITEIGLSLGYADLYSFSRAFRNYYGAAPGQLIKNGNPDQSRDSVINGLP